MSEAQQANQPLFIESGHISVSLDVPVTAYASVLRGKSKFSASKGIKCQASVTDGASKSHVNKRYWSGTIEKHTHKVLEQFQLLAGQISVSRYSRRQIVIHMLAVFGELVFYTSRVLTRFIQSRTNRPNHFSMAFMLNGSTLYQCFAFGMDKPLIFSMFEKRHRTVHGVDLYPYSRHVLNCLHYRPRSTIYNHLFFWQYMDSESLQIELRTITNILCLFLRKFEQNADILKLVVYELHRICERNVIENWYFGSTLEHAVQLFRTMEMFFVEEDYVMQCMEFIIVLLRARHMQSFQNIAQTIQKSPQAFIPAYMRGLSSLNLDLVVSMSNVRNSLYSLGIALYGYHPVSPEHRLDGMYMLSLAINAFHKDPDSWPLLRALTSLVCGEEECRTKFRDLQFHSLIPLILSQSREYFPLSRECYKVLDVASDGKPKNIITLFRHNYVLKKEIFFALKHLSQDQNICNSLLSLLFKLIKTDMPSSRWFMYGSTIKLIEALPKMHRGVIYIECKANQLVMMYNQHVTLKKSPTLTACDVERSRRVRFLEKENPRKARIRAARDRTRAPLNRKRWHSCAPSQHRNLEISEQGPKIEKFSSRR